mmetsp:Transcript_21056/g.65006  ORF Transcript_21056/g.65006 Transcript_21056/m.65006 type:complete len:223 (+) Transcript_21056:488-1156(+)
MISLARRRRESRGASASSRTMNSLASPALRASPNRSSRGAAGRSACHVRENQPCSFAGSGSVLRRTMESFARRAFAPKSIFDTFSKPTATAAPDARAASPASSALVVIMAAAAAPAAAAGEMNQTLVVVAPTTRAAVPPVVVVVVVVVDNGSSLFTTAARSKCRCSDDPRHRYSCSRPSHGLRREGRRGRRSWPEESRSVLRGKNARWAPAVDVSTSWRRTA